MVSSGVDLVTNKRTIETTALVGIALESNSDDSEKLVECVLKV